MKTIQVVAAGSAAAGNNASVTPGLPSGTVVGDVVLIQATIRNAGTGIPDTPTGWKTLLLYDNMGLYAKVMAQPEDLTLPTVTFSGGVANATTLAQAFTVRQCSTNLDALVHNLAAASNASAANIALPALAVTRDGCLVLHLGWRQSNWTSVAAPAGDTLLGSNSSALGSTAAQVLSGVVQTAASSPAATSFVVTGGSAAVSRAVTVALLPYVTTWTDIANSDAPCDFPTEFNKVSNAACTAIQAIEAAESYLTDLPAFRVSSDFDVPSVDQIVPYAVVDIDPEGIADLVKDPYSVETSRAGVWFTDYNVTSAVSADGNQVLFGDYNNQERLTSTRDNNGTNNPPIGGGSGSASSMIESTDSSPVNVSTFITSAGPGSALNPSVNSATMHGIWVSD